MSVRSEGDRQLRKIEDRAAVRSDLNTVMQRVSMVVAGPALMLMLAGFVVTAVTQPLVVPGPSAAPVRLGALTQPGHLAGGAMSTGILLLAVIPFLSVLVGATLYARRRHGTDLLWAVVVMVELLVSAKLKSGG